MSRDGPAKTHVVTLIDYPAAVGGGAEVLAEALLLQLDPERFERTFCIFEWERLGLPREDQRAAEQRFRDAGVRLLALERRSRWDLLAWRPLVTLLRSGQVDLLHAHKFGPNVWASLLRILTRVPALVTHEHTWSYEGQSLRRFLDRHLIARMTDAFLAVSELDRSRMIAIEHIPPRAIEVVTNGIVGSRAPTGADVRSELGIPMEAPVVGTVAVLRPQKALEFLLEAMALLRRGRHPDIRLLVVGRGPELDRLRRRCVELGLEECVTFLGFRSDIPDVLAAFDVAASSSSFEGTPLAVIEYMAAGLPIVATRVGGVPDIIDSDRQGVLVDPGDPAQLAEAIGRLLDDRELARRLGAAARRRQARTLTIQQTARHVESVYERVLTRRGRGLQVEPLRDGLEGASEAWSDLAEQAVSPFATYEWARSWWRTYGQGRAQQVLACRRRDGSLAALLPLCTTRHGSLRVTRFLGHGPSDQLGPVCAPADTAPALAALRQAMARRDLRTDLMVAERLPAAEGVDQAFGGAVLQREASPAISLEGLTWEGFLAARSRNFRSQVRRRERGLERNHDVRFRLTEDPGKLAEDMSTLFRLHDARWAAAGSGALTGHRAAFHRDFAAGALERGWLRLWTMEVDGRPVAAWYGLRFGGREWYYQSGRDPAWEDRSVGSVLLAHTIRAALQDGMLEYRLLRGGEQYKSRFATHDHPVQTNVAAGTALGRLVVAATQTVGVQRPRLRAVLKRALN